jgi:anti-sigma factor RsiW
MSCRKFRKMILLYREGELSAREAQMLAEHIIGCPSCANKGASVAELSHLIRRSHEMSLEPSDPEELTRKILLRIAPGSLSEPSPTRVGALDRLLDLTVNPRVRLASALLILVTVALALWQYFGILGDVRTLEAQQMHRSLSLAAPQVGYAVDTRPLRGTPEGNLLNQLGSRRGETSIVVASREVESLRESGHGPEAAFFKVPLLFERASEISRLLLYVKTNAHPILCFPKEGA